MNTQTKPNEMGEFEEMASTLKPKWSEEVAHQALEFEDLLQGLVRQKPLACLAGAVAVGFFAQTLMNRRKA